MNVAIFTESYKPYVNGVSVSVTAFTDKLRARGDNVYIFAPYMPGYVDEDPHVFRYPSVRFPSRFLQYEPDYSMALGRFPGLDHVLRFFFNAEISSLKPRSDLYKLLHTLPIDLVHTQSPFAMGSEGTRWARVRNVPLVTTFHTQYTEYTHYTPFIPKPISTSTILRWTRVHCNGADRVIAPTEGMRELLRSWGITRPISILATGIDPEMFKGGDGERVRKRHGIPKEALFLLYAGRLAPEKNIPILFQMLMHVLKKRPDAVLLFAGAGPSLQEIHQLAEYAGVLHHVRFAGYVPREEMRDYHAAADIFTFPSRTETQGLVICEAMAAGVPCVAVDSAAARSVVLNGREGYLTANEPEAMAERILELAADADLRARMSKNGQCAAEQFGIDDASDRLREIYEAVIEKRADDWAQGVMC